MTLPLPDLDDRRYTDLVHEIVSLVPRYAPAWTDHNPSDPGIMLIELFAWLFEAMMYRQNRVTEEAERTLLALLNGRLDGRVENTDSLGLDEAKARTIVNLRKPCRAVTPDDFETLVLSMAEPRMARVKCLPGLNLEAEVPSVAAMGHVSLILVPFAAGESDLTPSPSVTDLEKVAAHLDTRRLITTRVHVVAPLYVRIAVKAVVMPRKGERTDLVKANVDDALRRFFHPLTGGFEGKGWPFGRSVHASEVYQILEQVQGVDHVADLALFKDEGGVFAPCGNRIAVDENALVYFDGRNPVTRIRIMNNHE